MLVIIAGIIGVLVDIPLIIGILQKKIDQSFATYFLWGTLDAIAFVSIILQGGNFWLPLGYAIGALTVAGLLAFRGKVNWSWLESLVVVLCIICMIVWWQLGNKAATIASVAALGIASIPQIVGTYKDPKTTPTLIYFVFTLAGLLSFIGGENWTVEDKLYSGTAFLLSLSIALLSLRRPLVNK